MTMKSHTVLWLLCLALVVFGCGRKANKASSETVLEVPADTLTGSERDTADPLLDSISPYDELIKKTATNIGWDWRLFASIIYQESRFKTDLESSRGAYGPMQLMPSIMDHFDVDHDSSIEEHLEAGGKLLLRLEEKLPEEITDSLEQRKFVLAAYNAGLNAVLSARTLAEENGKDPNVWEDNVENYLSGQTVNFVKNVMERYSHYKTLTE